MFLKIGVLLLVCISTVSAQLKYTDEYIRIGEEQYTPIIIDRSWGIDYYNGGLNFWIPYPLSNWGNYKLFLQDDGNIGVGKKPSYKLDVAGDVATSGKFLVNSDKRFKSDISPLSDEIVSSVLCLNGKSFRKKIIKQCDEFDVGLYDSVKYKTRLISYDHQLNNKSNIEYGFIAQEVQEYFPDLVNTISARIFRN